MAWNTATTPIRSNQRHNGKNKAKQLAGLSLTALPTDTGSIEIPTKMRQVWKGIPRDRTQCLQKSAKFEARC